MLKLILLHLQTFNFRPHLLYLRAPYLAKKLDCVNITLNVYVRSRRRIIKLTHHLNTANTPASRTLLLISAYDK